MKTKWTAAEAIEQMLQQHAQVPATIRGETPESHEASMGALRLVRAQRALDAVVPCLSVHDALMVHGCNVHPLDTYILDTRRVCDVGLANLHLGPAETFFLSRL